MGPNKAWGGPNKIWGPGIDLRTPWKILSLRPWIQGCQKTTLMATLIGMLTRKIMTTASLLDSHIFGGSIVW